MKTKLLFLTAALTGCLPILTVKEANDGLYKNVICYQDKHQIIVLADLLSHCIPKEDFESLVDQTASRVGVKTGDLAASAYTFQQVTYFHGVRTRDAIVTYDEAGNPRVFIRWNSNWRTLVAHELGHQLHRIKHPEMRGDPRHQDCLFWAAIDPRNGACGDLWHKGYWR